MSKYFYDEYYKTEEVFGKPCNELINFFEKLEPKGKLMSLGCGQGRDSIALARLGYNVTALDYSEKGVEQMMSISKKENLGIKGIVEDIYKFNNYSDYDIILFDCFFRFSKQNRGYETVLISRAIKSMRDNSILCFCIKNSDRKVKRLKQALNDNSENIEIIKDSTLCYDYENGMSSDLTKNMFKVIIIKKINKK